MTALMRMPLALWRQPIRQYMKPPVCLCLVWLAMIACAPLAAADEYTDSDLFDSNFLHEIRLYFQPTDWQTLKDNYLENTYYPVQMVWRGVLVPNVGIRSRGRTTRNAVKPCLRIDFHTIVDNQKFIILKGLQKNAVNSF